jgi:hypothetical protein
MKRAVTAVLVTSLWVLAAPANASAQAMIGVGGGVTFPTGDYADYANTGWLAAAGVAFPVGDVPVSISAHGFYGSNNHEAPDGDKTNLYGALAGVSYAFGDPEGVSPFVGGLAGFMHHSYKSESQPSLEGSESGLAGGAFAGVGFPLGGIGGFVEAYWLTGFGDIDSTQLFGAMAGVQFPLGGGGM